MDYMKLVKFYRAHCIPGSALSDDALCAYFIALDHRKNLIVELDLEQEIIGFIELWRINYEQLGRIMVHGLIDAREENTTDGELCFLANLAIHPSHYRGPVADLLRRRFFKENYTCSFFCGDSRRRAHHHTFNIYPRTEIMSKYLTLEVAHG
jgi:hypothetical protein